MIGIKPVGNKVMVLADQIEEKTEGGIYIPESVKERHQMSACYGVIIDMGEDCFTHTIQRVDRYLNGKWVPFERKTTGYAEPFANIGDRISYSMYQGKTQTGEDGIEYTLIHDEDIISIVSEQVVQTSIEARKSIGME